jgi:hypothetical protein
MGLGGGKSGKHGVLVRIDITLRGGSFAIGALGGATPRDSGHETCRAKLINGMNLVRPVLRMWISEAAEASGEPSG